MNLLNFLGPILSTIVPARGTVYLLLAALASGFAGGVWITKKFWDASEVTAVNEARAEERDATLLGNGADKGVLDRARQRREINDAIRQDLERRLAHAPRCPVPVPAEWLSGGELPRPPRDPGRPRPTDPDLDTPAGPIADARDVVRTCERNRTEVYQPEADERQAIRDWYNALRERFNR